MPTPVGWKSNWKWCSSFTAPPAPLVISRAAAGHTEWYRGAYTVLVEAAERLRSAEGYRLHSPLRAWLVHQLQQRPDFLFEWTQWILKAIREAQAIGVDATRGFEITLGNTLDAYAFLGLQLEANASSEVQEWHRSYRQRRH